MRQCEVEPPSLGRVRRGGLKMRKPARDTQMTLRHPNFGYPGSFARRQDGCASGLRLDDVPAAVIVLDDQEAAAVVDFVVGSVEDAKRTVVFVRTGSGRS